MSSRLLIADDDPEILDLMRLSFETHGHSVRAVADGQAALEELRKEEPDLLVLDIEMPRMNGYETVERIRAEGLWPSMPILMVSALTRDSRRSDQAWARSLGVDAFVAKPFNPLELVEMAESVLKKRRGAV